MLIKIQNPICCQAMQCSISLHHCTVPVRLHKEKKSANVEGALVFARLPSWDILPNRLRKLWGFLSNGMMDWSWLTYIDLYSMTVLLSVLSFSFIFSYFLSAFQTACRDATDYQGFHPIEGRISVSLRLLEPRIMATTTFWQTNITWFKRASSHHTLYDLKKRC